MPARRVDVRVRLGRKVRELREKLGMTQEEVGERAGYSGKYVSEIERGLRNPPLTTIDRILERGLGVPFVVAEGVAAESAKSAPHGVWMVRERTLPTTVQHLADEIAEIDDDSVRRQMIALVRGLLDLARGPAAPRRRRRGARA